MVFRVEEIFVLRCDQCFLKIEDPFKEKLLKEEDDLDRLMNMDVHVCNRCKKKGSKIVLGNDLIEYCKANNIETDEIDFWENKRFIGLQDKNKKWDLSSIKRIWD